MNHQPRPGIFYILDAAGKSASMPGPAIIDIKNRIAAPYQFACHPRHRPVVVISPHPSPAVDQKDCGMRSPDVRQIQVALQIGAVSVSVVNMKHLGKPAPRGAIGLKRGTAGE